MKTIITIAIALVLTSFAQIEFDKKDLIGKWKIQKLENSNGSSADSTAFYGQTFTYYSDQTVVHLNPQNPFEKKQTGNWEISNDTLYQFNTGEKKTPFKILILNKSELVVSQQIKDVKTTIFYTRIDD
jgi:hypothetical protein